jgi:hypothetical protein
MPYQRLDPDISRIDLAVNKARGRPRNTAGVAVAGHDLKPAAE